MPRIHAPWIAAALVVGALVGAAVLYGLDAGRLDQPADPRVGSPERLGGASTSPPSRPGREPPEAATSLEAGTSPDGRVTTAEKLAMYRLAVGAGHGELGRLIDEAAARPETTRGQLELGVLLERLAELDAAAALRRAVDPDLGLEPDTLVSVFAAVAVSDTEAALAALRELAELGDARAVEPIGLALLDAVRNDPRLIERLLDAVSGGVYASLHANAVAALAELDPDAALARLLALPDRVRARALYAAAEPLAERVPRRVLDRIDAVGDVELRDAVIRAWLRRDAIAALRYLATLDESEARRFAPPSGTLMNTSPGSRYGDADPRELLELSMELPAELGRDVRARALQTLSARDPSAAAEYLDRVPPVERAPLAIMIANRYAEIDPVGALEWARRTRLPNAVSTVLGRIAQSDPHRALEIALETAPAAVPEVVSRAASSGTDVRALGDAIVALPRTGLTERALTSLMSSWVLRDAESALEWLLVQAGSVPNELYFVAASRLARAPDVAAEYARRVPSEVRGSWIRTTAQSLANIDPIGALDWLEPFRAEPAYAPAVAVVAERLARADGPAAARLLDGISLAADPTPVAAVALHWAANDPAAAAQWAERLDDPDARAWAVRPVAQTWSSRDPVAAERWVLSLPSGRARDGALTWIARTIVDAGDLPSARLLEAYSTDAARQRAAISLVRPLRDRDPAAARAFLDRHVTDPSLRARAERLLDPTPSAPASGGFFGPVRQQP